MPTQALEAHVSGLMKMNQQLWHDSGKGAEEYNSVVEKICELRYTEDDLKYKQKELEDKLHANYKAMHDVKNEIQRKMEEQEEIEEYRARLLEEFERNEDIIRDFELMKRAAVNKREGRDMQANSLMPNKKKAKKETTSNSIPSSIDTNKLSGTGPIQKKLTSWTCASREDSEHRVSKEYVKESMDKPKIDNEQAQKNKASKKPLERIKAHRRPKVLHKSQQPVTTVEAETSNDTKQEIKQRNEHWSEVGELWE